LTTTNAPPYGRQYASAVYDPMRDEMIVYGGFDGFSTVLDDTWSLSLATLTWTKVLTPLTPAPARQYHAAIFDPLGDRMLVFGGSDASFNLLNDVWQFRPGPTPEWSHLTPEGTPPSARQQAAAVYDSRLHRMIVLGGQSSGPLSDLFALRLDAGA